MVAGAGRVTPVTGAGGLIRPGVLTAQLPPALVAAAVAACGSGERRRCRLPAVAVVYFVISLCLFSGADTLAPPGYRPVMSSLMRGVRPAGRYRLPVSSAFTKARQRLGQAPLRWLFEQTRGPVASPGTPGAYALGCGWCPGTGRCSRSQTPPPITSSSRPVPVWGTRRSGC